MFIRTAEVRTEEPRVSGLLGRLRYIRSAALAALPRSAANGPPRGTGYWKSTCRSRRHSPEEDDGTTNWTREIGSVIDHPSDRLVAPVLVW